MTRFAPLALAFTLLGCGGQDVEFVDGAGKASTVAVKGSALVTLTATKTLATKETLRASNARVYLASYEADVVKAPKADGESRIYFSLNGPKGTDHTKDPIPTGHYDAGADWEMRASDFELVVFEGGRAERRSLGVGIKGGVDVTKSSLEEIEGTLDVTSQKGHLKGAFKAKLKR